MSDGQHVPLPGLGPLIGKGGVIALPEEVGRLNIPYQDSLQDSVNWRNMHGALPRIPCGRCLSLLRDCWFCFSAEKRKSGALPMEYDDSRPDDTIRA